MNNYGTPAAVKIFSIIRLFRIAPTFLHTVGEGLVSALASFKTNEGARKGLPYNEKTAAARSPSGQCCDTYFAIADPHRVSDLLYMCLYYAYKLCGIFTYQIKAPIGHPFFVDQ